MVIRTYWYGGKPRGNFGDQLGPILCEVLSGQRVEFAEVLRAEIVTIGSIIEPWFCVGGTWASYRGIVWGSGRMVAEEPIELPHARVLALRGRWSLQKTSFVRDSAQVDPVLGDPGLLSHLLAPTASPKMFQLGIIPHISEQKAPIVAQLGAISSEIKIVDMKAPVDEVIATVSSCRYVLSSALHGLILADSLGIPNRWLRLDVVDERRVGIAATKYLDYYSVFGGDEKTPVRVSTNETLQSLLERIGPYERPGLEQIQRNLVRSFPWSRQS